MYVFKKYVNKKYSSVRLLFLEILADHVDHSD